MKDNIVYQFLQELVIRLRSKSPKFFKVIQIISVAVAIIPGVPAFLAGLGVVLPVAIAALASKTIAICGIVAAFISGLPVDKDVPKTDSNNLKISDVTTDTKTVVQKDINLPFTDNNK